MFNGDDIIYSLHPMNESFQHWTQRPRRGAVKGWSRQVWWVSMLYHRSSTTGLSRTVIQALAYAELDD
jgi:hypothetical protein